MGVVYRAHDSKLGREVAIKVLPEALSGDAERLARFEREARILASLNHPGIATLYGLENDGGKHFLVMELVPGETLAERIARGPLAIDEAISIFGHIADALEAAHEKRVTHRDLKPANLMLTPEGKPKVLDFGLAKAQAADTPEQDLSQSPTFTERYRCALQPHRASSVRPRGLSRGLVRYGDARSDERAGSHRRERRHVVYQRPRRVRHLG